MTCRVSSARQSQKSACVCVCVLQLWLYPWLMEDSVSSLALSSFHMLLLSFLPSSLLHELISFIYLFSSATICLHRPRCLLSISIFGTLLSVGVLHEHHGYWNLINKKRQDWRRLTWLQLVSAQIYIVLGFIYCKCISSVCADVMWRMADKAFKVHIYKVNVILSLHKH